MWFYFQSRFQQGESETTKWLNRCGKAHVHTVLKKTHGNHVWWMKHLLNSFAVVQHTTSYCFLEQNKLKPNLLAKSNFNCSNATLQCALTMAHSNLVLPTITAPLGYGYLELSQGVWHKVFPSFIDSSLLHDDDDGCRYINQRQNQPETDYP